MVDVEYTRSRGTTPLVNFTSAPMADREQDPPIALTIHNSADVYGPQEAGSPIPMTCTHSVARVSNEQSVWAVLKDETKSYTLVHTSFGSVKSLTASMFEKYLQERMADALFAPTRVPMVSSYLASEIHDVPTTNFKKKIALGLVINNPVINEKFSSEVKYTNHRPLVRRYKPVIKRGWGGSTVNFDGWWVEAEGFYDVRPPTDVEVMAVLENHRSFSHTSSFNAKQTAINSAFGKVNSGAYSYLEELGEGKETILYLLSVFTRIANMIKAVAKGKWIGVVPRTHKLAVKRAKTRAKRNGTSYQKEYSLAVVDFATSAWMELRFAIRPLLIGVEDTLKLHKEGLSGHSGRSVQNYKCNAIGNTSDITLISDGTIETKTFTTVESVRTATAGVLIDIRASVANMRELGLTNLAGTAWELTFLSWAADYFVNLDGLLYKLTPDIGVDVLAAWSGTDDLLKVKSTITRTSVADGVLIDTVEYSTTIDRYQRHPIDGPSNITINIDLDIYKLADLGSLFYGMLRSLKK